MPAAKYASLVSRLMLTSGITASDFAATTGAAATPFVATPGACRFVNHAPPAATDARIPAPASAQSTRLRPLHLGRRRRHERAADDSRILERARHLGGGLRTLGRILLQQAHEQRRERLGHVVPARADRRRLFGELRGEQLLRRAPMERRRADEHLVADDAERVEIGAVIGARIARRLLGRHVRRRADRRADERDRSRARRRLWRCRFRATPRSPSRRRSR